MPRPSCLLRLQHELCLAAVLLQQVHRLVPVGPGFSLLLLRARREARHTMDIARCGTGDIEPTLTGKGENYALVEMQQMLNDERAKNVSDHRHAPSREALVQRYFSMRDSDQIEPAAVRQRYATRLQRMQKLLSHHLLGRRAAAPVLRKNEHEPNSCNSAFGEGGLPISSVRRERRQSSPGNGVSQLLNSRSADVAVSARCSISQLPMPRSVKGV